jgi:hypothetical protein
MLHGQALIVALLVLACAAYATWSLMPALLRRTLATQLMRLPLPAPLARRLARERAGGGGCACNGCDAARPPGTVAPVQIRRRRR